MALSIREITHDRLIDGVIKKVKPANVNKILVLDHLSTRVISSVCRMYDIMDEGVILVENIAKLRRPFRQYEAIYLVSPTEATIDAIISDFDKDAADVLYKKAHIFFTSMCPDALFKKLSSHKSVVRYIGTLEEIFVEFLPFESQTFHLDSPLALHSWYSSQSNSIDRVQRRIADQIATVCVTLGENPYIRYSTTNEQVSTLATFIQAKIDQYIAAGAINPAGKPRSTLYLLDRGFDTVSPLLHELTYQAMAYDLLPIENDVYKFKFQNAAGKTDEKEIILGESDRLWPDLRHRHIADAIRDVTDEFKKFVSKSKAGGLSKSEKVSVSELSEALKEMPQHQEEMRRYQLHVNLAESCMEYYKEHQLDAICSVEQNMVLGEDAEGNPVKNIIPSLVPLLQDTKISVVNKLRLLMLYVITKEGLPDAEREKFMEHASIPPAYRKAIENLRLLGVPVSSNDNKGPKKYKRRDRSEEGTFYALSRWIPVIKDILEDALEDRIDKNMFASVRDDPQDSSGDAGAAASVRTTKSGWAKTNKDKKEGKEASSSSSRKNTEPKTGPRLLMFVVGGVTYSELRSAYELNEKSKREIIIGSTHVITPKDFINQLLTLDQALDEK